MTRPYDRFNDQGLDELYKATPPGQERSVIEIAEAAGVARQVIYDIEKRVLTKLREAMGVQTGRDSR